MTGDGQVGLDDDPSRSVGLGSCGLCESGGEWRSRDARRPHGGARGNPRPRPVENLHLDRAAVDVDHGRPEHRGDSQGTQLRLRLAWERVRKGAEHAVGCLDQQDARLARIDRPVFGAQRAPELRDLACHLDAGRARADDDERQPGITRCLVQLGLRRFEREQNPVAQVDRPLERLQLGRVRRPLVVPEVRVARAARNEQHVVRNLQAVSAVRQVVDHDVSHIEIETGHLAQNHARVLLPAHDLTKRNRNFLG